MKIFKELPLKFIRDIALFPTDWEQIIRNSKLMGVDSDSAIFTRKKYLRHALSVTRSKIREFQEQSNKAETKIEQGLGTHHVKECLKFIKTITWEIQKLNRSFSLGEDRFKLLVERAKSISIEKILPNPIIHERTNCPFHADRKRSMLVRNNFAWCFSCNDGWDAISYVMKAQGCNFKQAVEYLSSLG